MRVTVRSNLNNSHTWMLVKFQKPWQQSRIGVCPVLPEDTRTVKWLLRAKCVSGENRLYFHSTFWNCAINPGEALLIPALLPSNTRRKKNEREFVLRNDVTHIPPQGLFHSVYNSYSYSSASLYGRHLSLHRSNSRMRRTAQTRTFNFSICCFHSIR